ncbi:hypothetical protein GW17_00023278 [Ensete ventricosum]|nr:hypothetical protein GW17_00023278 [Ensete ventricosum]
MGEMRRRLVFLRRRARCRLDFPRGTRTRRCLVFPQGDKGVASSSSSGTRHVNLGTTYAIGLGTFLKQFHPSHMTQYVQVMSHYME